MGTHLHWRRRNILAGLLSSLGMVCLLVFVCRHMECWGTDEFITLDTLGLTYLFAPLFLTPISPEGPLPSQGSDIVPTLSAPILFFHTLLFIQKVPFVWHLCWMKFMFFKIQLKCLPFWVSFPVFHLKLASFYLSSYSPVVTYPAHCVYVPLSTPVSRLRQTHVKSPNPYSQCFTEGAQ